VQDRFLADVGDFGKFGLLRHLTRAGPSWKLGIVWYAVASASTQCPAKPSYKYLSDAQLMSCDPELGAALSLAHSSGFRLADLRRLDILPMSTLYIEDPVPRLRKRRLDWLNQVIAAVRDRDLVFLDPDNGISPSNGSVAHVSYDELQAFSRLNASIVFYHHLNRRSQHDDQLHRLGHVTEEIATGRTAHILRYGRGGSRAFVIASIPEHRPVIERLLNAFIYSSWGQHFTYVNSLNT
jgi:hypothetical protein